MSKKTKQNGSVVLIVVIVAVLGLLGGVGYVVWKNYFSEPVPAVEVEDIPEETILVDTEETPATTTDTTTSTTPAASEDDDYYHITQWGLKGVISGQYSAQYELISSTHLTFSSRDLTGSCSGAVVGNIYRLEADDEFPSNSPSPQTVEQVYNSGTEQQKSIIKRIGSYYFVYISPQSGKVFT